MTKESIQVREVRWMGMGAGVVVMLIGASLLLGSGALSVVLVGSLFSPPKEPTPPGLWAIAIVEMAMGLPGVLYGWSLFRRASTDAVVVATTDLPPETKKGQHRGLAWTGAIFSSLLLLGVLGGALAAVVGNKPVSAGALYGASWFVAVLAASVRYLTKRR